MANLRILSPQVGLDPHLGGGRHDIEMLAALARLGHRVLVLLPTSERGRSRPPEGCEVSWVRAPWRLHPFAASVAFFPALLRAARAFRPDVIRVHSPYCLGLAGLAVGRMVGAPTVAAFHHSFERFPGARWTERRLLRRFSHVTTVSGYSRRQLAAIDPSLAARVSVVPNGVSDAFRPSTGDLSSWRAGRGLPAGDPLFVTVGSLTPRKNVSWLVDLAAAWVRGGRPGTFVVVGDGPERAPIAGKLASTGLERTVVFWGEVDDDVLVPLLQAADVFLLPSLMEGFGLAPAEALACGTPAVVSDRGALPEVVRHARTGYVLPLDLDDWLVALDMLVSRPDVRAGMGAAGAEDVRARFSWDRAAMEMTRIFEGLLDPSRLDHPGLRGVTPPGPR